MSNNIQALGEREFGVDHDDIVQATALTTPAESNLTEIVVDKGEEALFLLPEVSAWVVRRHVPRP
eukprot:3190725-Amphidinium_carterae.1